MELSEGLGARYLVWICWLIKVSWKLLRYVWQNFDVNLAMPYARTAAMNHVYSTSNMRRTLSMPVPGVLLGCTCITCCPVMGAPWLTLQPCCACCSKSVQWQVRCQFIVQPCFWYLEPIGHHLSYLQCTAKTDPTCLNKCRCSQATLLMFQAEQCVLVVSIQWRWSLRQECLHQCRVKLLALYPLPVPQTPVQLHAQTLLVNCVIDKMAYYTLGKVLIPDTATAWLVYALVTTTMIHAVKHGE